MVGKGNRAMNVDKDKIDVSDSIYHLEDIQALDKYKIEGYFWQCFKRIEELEKKCGIDEDSE